MRGVQDNLYYLGNFVQGHPSNIQPFDEKFNSCQQRDNHHNANDFHSALLSIKHIGCRTARTLKVVNKTQNCTSKENVSQNFLIKLPFTESLKVEVLGSEDGEGFFFVFSESH